MWAAITSIYEHNGVKNLNPLWKDPFMVTLTTLTAIKVHGIKAWVHYSLVHRAMITDINQAKQ